MGDPAEWYSNVLSVRFAPDHDQEAMGDLHFRCGTLQRDLDELYRKLEYWRKVSEDLEPAAGDLALAEKAHSNVQQFGSYITFTEDHFVSYRLREIFASEA